MNINDCDNGHKYDLWVLSEDASMASRECMNCGFVEVLRAKPYILEQVKKQIEASNMLKGFSKLSIDDPNFMGYLNIMLVDYIDYLYMRNKIEFSNMLGSVVANSYFLSEKNKLLINKFIELIPSTKDTTDSFCETLEKFQLTNIDTINNFIDIEIQKGYSK